MKRWVLQKKSLSLFRRTKWGNVLTRVIHEDVNQKFVVSVKIYKPLKNSTAFRRSLFSLDPSAVLIERVRTGDLAPEQKF